MTKQLKWRLGKLPTPDDVLKLVNDKLITKEEAREILFNKETTEERSIKDLESEIKFLKEVIEKMGSRTQIIEVTKQVLPIYIEQPWYKPYYYWSSGTSSNNIQLCGTASALQGQLSAGSIPYAKNVIDCNFSSIQTY